MTARPVHTLLALLVTALLATSTLAEDGRQQNWYQVELLIVAHTSPGAPRSEQWDALPRLQYPDAVRFLLDPQRLQANLERTADALHSRVDKRGKQLIQLRGQEADGAAADLPAAAAVDTPAPAPEVTAAPGAEVAAAEDAAAPRLPTPFVLLPAQAREFRGKAAYMERNGPYRILFHEVWWQPVGSARTALPIVLDRSGDDQAYPALQGTIRLHRSRFLHVDTRLWLNTNGDYLPGTWRMPAPPLAPASLELIAAPVLPTQPTAPEAPIGYDPQWDAASGLLDAPEPESAPAYPYRHAVLLQQQRRMRSNEVHYIDHPLLGLVIKLTPLDADALYSANYDQAILELITGPERPAEAAGSPAGA
ncbi:MAG: hypothetical protein CME43_03100 [Haliea sp.]|uniref:CsiV family protein n=1 Tax=Haliea sp. TaxID=1932666 RepID=UPI000C3AEBC5|nr:CsiV family protein [Haliea sp.]MBM68449.1 hypothetical protein [Haliea sp.]|tara:strand:+ start:27362 stop:28453 length:1092 start_codon:yes stop_codon:yes gene_type:complete